MGLVVFCSVMSSLSVALLTTIQFFFFFAEGTYVEHEHGEFSKPLWNSTYTDQLKRDLLTSYDKFARPAQHSNITTVFMDMDIKHVHLDDNKFLLTVNAWLKMKWRDEKLQWNISDYGGLKYLHLADHEIWQPDVALYNSALGNNVDYFGNIHCIAEYDGDVLWVPPTQFVVFCDMDLFKWPFDRHTCSLKLGSWTYPGHQIDIQLGDFGELEDSLRTMEVTEWEVVAASKKRSMTYYSMFSFVAPFVDIDFTLTIERRSPSYKAVVIVPAICTILLTLCPLWLPPFGRERFMLNGITAISTSIFLIYFTIRLPLIGECTPLVVLFYATSLLLVCCSIVMAVIFNNLAHSRNRLPKILVDCFRGRIFRILMLPSVRLKASYEEEIGTTGEELRGYDSCNEDRMIFSRRSPHEGWSLIAMAVDRILFLIYFVVYLTFIVDAVL